MKLRVKEMIVEVQKLVKKIEKHKLYLNIEMI